MVNIPKELIVRSLQKTSTAEEEARLNEWLHEDKQNIALFCEMREIMHSSSSVADSYVSQCWDELSCRLLPQTRQKDVRRHIIPVWLRYAAAILAGVIVASSVWLAFRPHTLIEKVVVRNVVYNHSGIREVMLPDRSVVWLNENSKLAYNEAFEGGQRDVALEGNAFFEIEKDTSKPFVVHAGNIRIRATGTTFFVRSSADNHTIVTLVSGSVDVNCVDANGNQTTLASLAQGQEADYNYLTSECSVKSVETDYYTAWKDGTYRFTNETLANIARQMEYHFGIKIQLSSRVGVKRFTGRIAPEHTMRDVMEIINQSRPITYRITQSTVYIDE